MMLEHTLVQLLKTLHTLADSMILEHRYTQWCSSTHWHTWQRPCTLAYTQAHSGTAQLNTWCRICTHTHKHIRWHSSTFRYTRAHHAHLIKMLHTLAQSSTLTHTWRRLYTTAYLTSLEHTHAHSGTIDTNIAHCSIFEQTVQNVQAALRPCYRFEHSSV
jgi:hypothetical protein